MLMHSLSTLKKRSIIRTGNTRSQKFPGNLKKTPFHLPGDPNDVILVMPGDRLMITITLITVLRLPLLTPSVSPGDPLPRPGRGRRRPSVRPPRQLGEGGAHPAGRAHPGGRRPLQLRRPDRQRHHPLAVRIARGRGSHRQRRRVLVSLRLASVAAAAALFGVCVHLALSFSYCFSFSLSLSFSISISLSLEMLEAL